MTPLFKASRMLLGSLLCVLLVGCAPTLQPVQTPEVLEDARMGSPLDLGWDTRELFRPGLVTSAQGVLETMSQAPVYHVEIQIKDDMSAVLGTAEVRYANRAEGLLEEIYFRLYTNTSGAAAVVTEMRVDDAPVEAQLEFANSAVRVSLPQPLESGQSTVISFDFASTIPQEMGGNYGLFGYFDGILVLDEIIPAIPVYNQDGWQVEVPPPNGDLSFYDASYYVVQVAAPAEMQLIGSGSVVSRRQEGDTQIVTFAAGPIRDFYLAASELFVCVSETRGETTLNSCVVEGYEDGARDVLQNALDSLASFEGRIGLYPYTELDLVSTPMQALGMEYPGVAAMALDLYDPQVSIRGVPVSVVRPSVVAHEVAHQWFYNVVGNNQIDEPWLDEAMAQYFTAMYYADTFGPGAETSYRESWEERWGRVDFADIPIGLPAGEYEGLEYGAIVYGRGPLFVASLREAMGDKAFDQFIRDYFATYSWDIATARGFHALAEQHCQCDLTGLFEEWVYAP